LGQDFFSLHYLGIMNRAQQSRNNQTVVNASRCDISLHTSRRAWLRSQFTRAEILSAIFFLLRSLQHSLAGGPRLTGERTKGHVYQQRDAKVWCPHTLSQTGWLYLGPCLSTSAGGPCLVLILFLGKTD
jgi:hypothetical protein